MNKIARSAFVKGRTIKTESSPDYKGAKMPYPIIAVKECHYAASCRKLGKYPHADFSIHATLVLEDSLDASHFEQEVSIKEGVDLMEEEDDEGEGYVLPGSSVDLDDVALRILHASLPIKVVRPGGDGKRPKGLLSEEDYEESLKENASSPFDKLKDYDVE
jgi:hypothetical protein